METTAYLALSRQTVLRRQMEVIAHNIANMNTSGFQAEALALEPTLRDAGNRDQIAFVQDFATVRDLTPGPLVPTGGPLDLAIEGDGWFAFQTEGGVRYGRAGNLQLNRAGEIVSPAGDPLLDDGGGTITIPLTGSDGLTIAPDGTVSAGDALVGRVGVVRFAEPQAMSSVGGGLFATDQPPLPADGLIVQGTYEGSNVKPVVEMTLMMSTVRAYQSTQRVLETHHELQRRAIERMLQGASGQA
jgi:flagellar basal-body rod protein FlgF